MDGETTASASHSQDAHPSAEPSEGRSGGEVLGRPGTEVWNDNLEAPDNQDSSSLETPVPSSDGSDKTLSSLPEDASEKSNPPPARPLEDQRSTSDGNADVGDTPLPNSSAALSGPPDRLLAGVCSLFIRPTRVVRSAIVLKPSTILDFHRHLRTRKYRVLFSPTRRGRPGPKGPSRELVAAIVEMKRRNPRWGCPRIARQIGLAFEVPIDKDVVRRVLATRYRPESNSNGPSWLTFLGHAKDSLWSIDLFRCESATLRSHWVLVVMDQYTRRIVGFGIHSGVVDGQALCCMFNHAIRAHRTPKYLSADNDPLYRFYQWHANLRVLHMTEVKSVPYVPLSHPFVERLIGTLRRECLDRMLFWSARDLDGKLTDFQDFYNAHRAHAALDGRTPVLTPREVARLNHYRWEEHARGLYQTPIAA